MTALKTTVDRPKEPFGRSLQSRLLVTFGIGVISTILSGIGLYGWSKSDWMDDVKRTKRPWYGWDLRSVAALFVFNLLAPVAFCVMFTVFQFLVRFYSTSKTMASSYKLSIIASCVFFFAITAFGFYWSIPYLKCGFILCFDTPFWTMESTNGKRSEGGIGFEVNVGLPFIVLGIGCLGVMVAAYLENRRLHATTKTTTTTSSDSSTRLLSDADTLHPSENTPSLVQAQDEKYKIKRYTPYNIHLLALSDDYGRPTSSSSRVTLSSSKDTDKMKVLHLRTWVIFILMALFIIACFMLSTYIPNEFRKWYPTRINNQVRTRISHDEYECRHKGEVGVTCPEVPTAVMKSFSYTVNEYFTFKFFASNVIYFSFLLIAPLCALIFQQSKTIDTFLSQKIRVPKPFCRRGDRSYAERSAFFSGYELLMMLFTLLIGYLFFHYWFFDHNYSGYWPARRPVVMISEIWCRAIGQVAVFFFALLLFPAARSSPILSFFGVSWEAAIQYHRWLGVLFMVMMVGHALTAYWWYWDAGMFPDAVWRIPHPNPKTRDNFTLPGIQILTWLSVVTIGVMAVYEPLRRKRYNLFLFAHHFTYMALIPSTIWHAAAAWEYMLPGLAIWFSDRLIRAYRSLRAVYLVSKGDMASALSKSEPQQTNMYSSNSIDYTFNTPDPIISIHHHRSNYYDKTVGHLAEHDQGSIQVLDSPYGVNTDASHSLQVSGRLHRNALTPHDISKHRNASHIANSGYGVRLLDRGEAGQYIELRVVNNHMVYFPGHYAFLNIAELSLFEWHPFTMASPVHYCGRSEIVFLIKTMGPNTWTQALYNYIETEQQYVLPHERLDDRWAAQGYVNVPMTLSIDGPYGTPVDFTTYDVILLLGGGVGITPCKSVYESLLLSYLHDYKARQTSVTAEEIQKRLELEDLKKRIHLMFMARDVSLFDIMDESLEPICQEHHNSTSPFTASLYCTTKGEKTMDHKLGALIKYQRPDIHRELADVVQAHCDDINNIGKQKAFHSDLENPTAQKTSFANPNVYTPRVLVFTCGPEAMTKEAELVAHRFGWDYHCETFEL